MKDVSKIFIVAAFGSPIKDLKLCLNEEWKILIKKRESDELLENL
jgi:hypothetical protein